jgi:N-formylglutamate amidohydrolase
MTFLPEARMAIRGACLGSGLAVLAATVGAAAAAEPGDVVIMRAGGLPVILTAPHGGTAMIPAVPERTRGVTSRDAHTLELAQDVAARLTPLLGAPPYLVAARFSRKQIDANRAEAEALESDAARPVYHAYHDAIRRFAAEVRRRFPGGALLIDLHGQSTDPSVIHRGTQDGRTMPRLLARHGVAVLSGPTSILGALGAAGYVVLPPPHTQLHAPRESAAYRGGFTVQTYSADPEIGLDALQIEIGITLRGRATLADDLAQAIATFVRAYLT